MQKRETPNCFFGPPAASSHDNAAFKNDPRPWPWETMPAVFRRQAAESSPVRCRWNPLMGGVARPVGRRVSAFPGTGQARVPVDPTGLPRGVTGHIMTKSA